MQSKLPLNNLNTFAAAAENLSFQRAAESLCVTPSAVSHQIRNLEKLLGYPLFERLDKAVSLTPQGERLFADVKAPIKQLHDAGRKALRGMEGNSLALSVAPVFATGWLLPRLKSFYVRYPDISLSVIATTDLVNFESGGFDASIRMGRGDWQNTHSLRLVGREIAAVCLPRVVERNKGFITPSRLLSKYPLIQNASMPDVWDEWCLSLGINVPDWKGGMIRVQSSAQVVEAIQSGEAIGLVDRTMFPQDLTSGRLTLACEHILQDDGGYFLTYPESSADLSSLQCFEEWIRLQLQTGSE